MNKVRKAKEVLDAFEKLGLEANVTNDYTCDKCKGVETFVINLPSKICLGCLTCGHRNFTDNELKKLAEKELIAQNQQKKEDVPPVFNQPKTQIANNYDVVRPQSFEEICGNENIIQDLKVIITSSVQRGEALENILLFGPPGLGKTTIASAIAIERGVNCISISASTIKKGDVFDILTDLNQFDVLFIDEIHDLNKSLALTLYTAMEDNYIDIVNNGDARRVTLPDFTVIGATTDPGKLLPAMRSRFGNQYTLSLYPEDVLYNIIVNASCKLNVGITIGAVNNIAKRSRGTPRNAIAMLKKARAYADTYNNNFCFDSGRVGANVDDNIAQMAFDAMNIDEFGMGIMDRKYLEILSSLDTAGLDTIAATMGEAESNLSAMVEPWLLAQGYILRTNRGRQITVKGKNYLRRSE